MTLTTRAKYGAAIAAVVLLFLLNGAFLWFQQRYDTEFHNDPIYPTYLRMRNLLLQPGSILLIVFGLVLWFGLLYWKSRSRPVSDTHKIVFICIVLGTIGGFILTALFKL